MTQLISNEYKEQCILLHQQSPQWGNAAGDPKLHKSTAQFIRSIWEHNGKGSILDYGCGKGYVAIHLDVPVMEYDPGIPGKDQSPEPAALVVCLDVLEHIEPEYLEVVLKDLQRVVLKRGIFSISHNLATAILPDGRNAHLIIKDSDWWLKKLLDYFHIEFFSSANHQSVVVLKKLHDGSY